MVVLNPVFMPIFTLVFQHVIRLGIEDYPVFVLSVLLPWTYFRVGPVSSPTTPVRCAP